MPLSCRHLYREGLSVALIEGASAGLPLVGSRLGGIPEVIGHQANGFLVRPGDCGDLAAAIGQLMTQTRICGGRMGQAAAGRSTRAGFPRGSCSAESRSSMTGS